MSTETLQFTRSIKAPLSEAFRAFTRSVALREWMCDGAVVECVPGGRYHLWWHSGYYACGEFVEVDPDRTITFTWHGRDEPGPMQVAVTLTPGDADSIVVSIAQSGFGAGDGWDRARSDAADGWTAGLENLQSVLETGQDLRYVYRPMLGIYIDEFTPEIAQKLGVPSTSGTRLSGVAPDMGAAQAGLQKDDVIVALAGQPAPDYPHIGAAIGPRRAGDTVTVEFYRNAERRVVEMQLSGRQIPAVPAAPAELAEAIRQANAASLADLERILQGASDAEATHHPAPGEWNVLKVLAHLVAHERELQVWIADLLCDDERWSDRFENTEVVPARVAATAKAYPTLGEMVDLLRRSQDETTAMLAALPAEFVAHRGTYWRLGRTLLEAARPPTHVHEHAGQIQASIAAARNTPKDKP